MSRQAVTILGSTGSIGVQTLDIIARHPDLYHVEALTACQNDALLLQQCQQFRPSYVALVDTAAAARLREALKAAELDIEVLEGSDALTQLAALPTSDVVVAAIVGAAGLLPNLAAVRAGKRVLLANKEALIMSGHLFMEAVQAHQATLLPVDSEHNAIFQSMPTHFLPGNNLPAGINSIVLTASGGPFLKTPTTELADVTPEQAVAHPNWAMGAKISVDSATMMNKALEVIECHWLFGASLEQIEVIIHPQSIVHSMVRYADGSVLAQLGQPDMRTPIAHCLAWPERVDSGVEPLDFASMGTLNFHSVDAQQFPAVNLAYQVLRTGGTASCVLNAANEVAVQAFLQGQLRFTQIVEVAQRVLDQATIVRAETVDIILQQDQWARQAAQNVVMTIGCESSVNVG